MAYTTIQLISHPVQSVSSTAQQKHPYMVNSLSQAGTPSPPNGWPALSTELKLQILTYYTSIPSPIGYAAHAALFAPQGLIGALIQTQNHKTVILALETYYKTNTFLISAFPAPRMIYPSPTHAPSIRSLHFLVRHCYLGLTLEDLILGLRSSLRMLLTPARPLDRAALTLCGGPSQCGGRDYGGSTAWQALFCNLRALRVEIHVHVSLATRGEGRCGICFLDREDVEGLAALLEQTSMGIKAAEVEAVVKTIMFFGVGPLRCECLRVVERVVEGLARRA
ncbi:hypothetical protein P153DRAFT_94270 [Dothidotthia symphoricarpi CBS 119687]|uniref:Uncharacterized protein n=1 Tax=Dothidotthia symphoricarpi CBS 119687 TaxID=1392245 RepID=A0A6A6A3P6_9PLEO|nr:uncharacterized protein P153DRAFT_94270 [Dothidotthia symphoricarpi CBS 119687]KAF2125805.1 hypothetical protein P153DRAFT_94270 [Dothidotthia symphoricarpi CBS 119687]